MKGRGEPLKATWSEAGPACAPWGVVVGQRVEKDANERNHIQRRPWDYQQVRDEMSPDGGKDGSAVCADEDS